MSIGAAYFIPVHCGTAVYVGCPSCYSILIFGGTNGERNIGREIVVDVKHLEGNLTQVSSQTVCS